MKTLTEEQKRIAIAKACGWEWKRSDQTIVCEWHDPLGNVGGFIPNYFHDLNAMQQAEKAAYQRQPAGWLERYEEALTEICSKAQHPHWHAWGATAAQRAGAFGRSLGLW